MNTDQVLLHQFAASPATQPVPMATNPMLRLLNTRLARVDRTAGRVELHFEPGEECLQGHGVVQGGAVSAMLDFAMAFAALAKLDGSQSATTANLNVSFLRSAQAGSPLVAVGEVDRAGRSLVFTSGRLSDSRGQLIATATSTLPVIVAG